MGPCRYLIQQPAWTAIKLATLCAIGAVILDGYPWVRWLSALVLITATRWLSLRCAPLNKPLNGRQKDEQTGHTHRLAPTTDHNVEQQLQFAEVDRPHQGHRDRNAWKRHISSARVAVAWENLCNSVVQEFIYDSWFSQLSPDREFPSEVRWLLNHAFGQFCRRATRLDWIQLLVRDCSTALCATLQLYRTAAEAIGPDHLQSLPPAEADAAIRQVLSQSRGLHPAFWTPDGQYRACRCLADAVLVHILPPEVKACPMARLMLRESFATCLIRSLLASLAPYSVQKMLLHYLTGTAQQGPPTTDQQQAAAEFQQKASNSSQAELAYSARQKLNKRSRKSQRGPSGPNNAKAKAKLCEIGLKRSKSLGDVKDAGSRSPVSSAAAAAAGVARTAMSVTARQLTGRWRETGGVLQGPQGLMGGVTAVKAAAQQLSLKKRFGSDPRLSNLKASAISALSCSPVDWLSSESPRSSTAPEALSSPDRFSSYKRAASAAAKAISAGGASPAASNLGWFADSASDSSWSGPMIAGLSNLGRPSSTAADSSVQQHERLQMQVVNAEMLNIAGKDCIVYRIRVADDRGEWTITRRYRHFEALHKHLRDSPTYRELGVNLPPKRLLSARDAPFVMKRREELDQYLQALLHNPYTASDPALLEFVSQQSQVFGMTAPSDEDGVTCINHRTAEQCGLQSEDSGNAHQRLVASSPEKSAYSCSTIPGLRRLRQLSPQHVSVTTAVLFTPAAVVHTTVGQRAVAADGPSSAGGTDMPCVGHEQLAVAAQQASFGDGIKQQKLQQQLWPSNAVSGQGLLQVSGLNSSIAKNDDFQRQSASDACYASSCHPRSQTQMEQQQPEGARQPQQSCQQHLQSKQQQQHVLEQLDSIDPSFCSLQARAGPSMPGSPPVPNKILPEVSLLLEAVGSVRTPGAPKQLTQQASDAAQEALASPAAVGQPAGITAQGTPGAGSSSVGPSPECTTRVISSGHCKSHNAQLQHSSAQPHTPDHNSMSQVHQRVQSPALASRFSTQEQHPAGAQSGTLQQGLSVQQAAAVSIASKQQQPGAVSAFSNSPRDDSTSGPLQAALASSSLRQAVKIDSSQCIDTSQPSSPSLEESIAWSMVEGMGPADLDSWQDQDCTGLIEPLYELIRCIFKLESSGFVRRPVFSMIRQLLSLLAGGAIDEFIQRTLSNSLSESNLCGQLNRLQAQLFPGGIWFARAAAAAAAATPGVSSGLPPRGPPVSAESYLDWTPPSDAEIVAEQLRQKLSTLNVPAPVLALVGKNAYLKAVADCFGVLQSRTLMYNLGLTVMETVLIAMFPGIKGLVRQMHQTAV